MHKYTKKEFTRSSLQQRYLILKEQGEYIAARQIGDHRVYLYAVSNFYVEMWILFCINEIRWIEIQENQNIINEYADNVKLNDLKD
ncbi:hypothetical protein [Brumimicrobium aurantiacum]|uniref:Uncharacterized protein n=1 Tax=Brumimicrobium aurantiacum TaxID=1737063 RepID=A0A3E1EW54_9FLAO|nr:hypothetical protein [Brumimicrobium aurantiacum]RFC53791.1 hypothetical protein DXU93_11735 [Brumimicrobium aurantiacum]